MKIAEKHAKIEEACPGFFTSIEDVVAGAVDLDVAVDRHVNTVNTEAKCQALGQLLVEFQRSMQTTDEADLVWLAETGTPLCQLLIQREQILRERRNVPVTRIGSLTKTQLQGAVEVGTRMKRYADAVRFLVGTLHRRAHVVERHWGDLPLA